MANTGTAATSLKSRKILIFLVVALFLSLVSDTVATFLFYRVGRHENPKVAWIFLCWLTISYAFTYSLALASFFVHRNMTKHKAATAGFEQGTAMRDFSRNSRLRGHPYRHSNAARANLPLTRLSISSPIPIQDHQARRPSLQLREAASVHDDLAIEAITPKAPKSPFDRHPNPLGISPVRPPPPTFSTTALLRAQASDISGFTLSTTISRGSLRDPFGNSATEFRTASSVSLTSVQAREVVAVPRSASSGRLRGTPASQRFGIAC